MTPTPDSHSHPGPELSAACSAARARTLALYLDSQPHPDALLHPVALRWVRPETGEVWGFKPQAPHSIVLTVITTPDCDGYTVLKAQQRSYKAHVLVWEVVNGPIPRAATRATQPEVNHINFVRHDNRIANLELLTPGENVRYSAAANRLRRFTGETNGNVKLAEDQVREILAQPDVSARILADRYDVTKSNIYMIRKGRTWAHLQQPPS
jgi:hypothetical protein